MQPRLDYFSEAPEAMAQYLQLENFLAHQSGLDPRLIHLIKLRASHLNGCAYCVDMHVKEAVKDGLGAQWVALVNVWQEAVIYDSAERAVLQWTDALTRMGDAGGTDAEFEALQAHFTNEEIVKISLVICTINGWNRLAVGFRTPHPLDNAA